MAAPLTKEDLDEINASLKGIEAARQVIARAKTAGIDVSQQEESLTTSEERLKAIKLGFFPSGRA